MEILCSTIPSTSHIFPKLSFSCFKSTQINKTHLKFSSRVSRNVKLSPTLALSNSKRFKISARFGGPTNRRNSLREKLTQHKQVRDDSLILDSGSDAQKQVLDFNAENLDSSLDSDRVENEGSAQSSRFKKESFEIYDDSVLSSKLRRWVDQYEADTEFWGIGSGRIFTVFRDSDGKVKRVDVNEEEILRRSGFDSALYKASELEDLSEVNSKISHAKSLATEMENGNNVLLEYSSVAKFVDVSVELGSVSSIRGFNPPPGLFFKMSRVGIVALCGLCVFWAVKRLFKGDADKTEKEMLRRKMKAGMEKDELVKGNVEVIQASKKVEFPSIEKPRLDRQVVMDNITKATALNNAVGLQTSSSVEAVKSSDFDDKIQKIKAMARHARELEKNDQVGLDGTDGEDDSIVNNELSSGKKVIQEKREKNFSSSNRPNYGYVGNSKDVRKTIITTPLDDPQSNGSTIRVKTSVENTEAIKPSISEIDVPNATENRVNKDKVDDLKSFDTTETNSASHSSNTYFNEPDKISVKAKPKVIRSVKEAREYLSRNRDKKETSEDILSEALPPKDSLSSKSRSDGETSQQLNRNHNLHGSSILNSSDLMTEKFASLEQSCESFPLKNVDPEAPEELLEAVDHQIPRVSSSPENSMEKGQSGINVSIDRDLERQRSQDPRKDMSVHTSDLDAKSDFTPSQTACEADLNAEKTIPTENTAQEIVKEIQHQIPDSNDVAAPAATNGNWMENNFHDFEPVAKKIAVGFKDNYDIARQKKINQELNHDSENRVPEYDEGDGELDWMTDDRLREIVFQVRENELMGRDPFHLMDAEDKKAFFGGLEKKVEKVNEKLQNLHQWVHSNVENLDYGADGISIHDPPEKVIPRWKGPPVDTTPQSLDDYQKQRQALLNENLRGQFIEKREVQSPLQASPESSPHESNVTSSVINNQNKINQDELVKPPKIIIEGSDGSVRAGKKAGEEYWEHTKKWSRGFLDSYNAETDPEIKATMKDIGKDLKRWITEKEIQESADLMDKLPKRGQKFIQEKLSKVKREMELYGPQAVMNKYSEYSEEKEEDYLWWLDLPYVLCIELYTNQDGDQNIGFYSLEMASDLELDPKQYHMIAFEDAGDCKNMCYIIQSHLEMLGNGNAFVIAQQPKDAYREARANGFNVTVVRKGELKLNVDQNLEEVEEQIIEIGSKMYHDKIMKGRSMDISSLTKSVFGIKKPKKRRSKKRLRKPTKS
ncbi:hypothetical protein DCAR_0206044 [Daucus carota subsp. sativus]|uniref:Uncharacterized protein n=1 Tax=Daucus carota subsp. sativus TaxID=79200 RepID=A0AAF0WCD0_DAUCS|nr:PREDICTED: uncharacterized protein LOC108208763 [Daucus carota subsp. sativus]XP_017234775.1 PREDICTED: uncharacterized protein LOC108208763 [Daucus carota subsp. sativus]WOG86826.1 hypothetical protein DCAR_0206044 [Daucus carota subsp. sativus]